MGVGWSLQGGGGHYRVGVGWSLQGGGGVVTTGWGWDGHYRGGVVTTGMRVGWSLQDGGGVVCNVCCWCLSSPGVTGGWLREHMISAASSSKPANTGVQESSHYILPIIILSDQVGCECYRHHI